MNYDFLKDNIHWFLENVKWLCDENGYDLFTFNRQ